MPTVDTPPVTTAKFSIVRGSNTTKVIDVDFNPESLQYTVSNTMEQRQPNNPGTQYVSQSVAKLTMDLVFDSTDTGVDVREKTEKMLSLLRPAGSRNRQVPPRVEFAWGVYRFAGMVEQYKETLDFFSHDGVPLRAAVNLTLTNDRAEFQSNHARDSRIDRNAALECAQVANPGGASDVASALGDPRAARAIAGLNGSDSLRFDASASLSVGGEVTLSPPAVFASGGVSLGGGAGFGAGVSSGGGVGGAIGAGGALSIEATAGTAFAGLRVGTDGGATAGAGLDAGKLLPGPGTGTGAGFSVGGAAKAGGGASLASDVGLSADLSARMRFGD